jgi:hypothetical protein
MQSRRISFDLDGQCPPSQLVRHEQIRAAGASGGRGHHKADPR